MRSRITVIILWLSYVSYSSNFSVSLRKQGVAVKGVLTCGEKRLANTLVRIVDLDFELESSDKALCRIDRHHRCLLRLPNTGLRAYDVERDDIILWCIRADSVIYLDYKEGGGDKEESSHKNSLLSNKLAFIGRCAQIELIGSAAGTSRRCGSGAWLCAQTGTGQTDREVQEHDIPQKGRLHLKAETVVRMLELLKSRTSGYVDTT
ncbi:hypothetical protein WR25_14014 [Diploscapter pachys]|uniref:FHA domain-containing protein n=1 Tax=Diploscapter pachys TaxID=2018661 RepID=A0A2A2KVE7_9BILA|nr:hypothetical protein WR25_14014 [Diploscapter pachys]